MSINLSPRVRQAIYVVVVFGTALLVPLNQGGLVPEIVMAVWTSVAGAASALAAINVNPEQ